MRNEIDDELERLREKKMELSGKLNITRDSRQKEIIRSELERLQSQIEMLERFKTKT